MPEISIEAARLAMIQKRFGGNVKGARTDDGVLRKKKSVHKSAGDDKKLAAVLKKLQLGTINGIEEVNIFKNNGEVIHIKNPKIQASTPSNTFVIGGNIEIKQLTELIPSILDQVGPETLDRLRRLASENGAPLQSTEEDDDEDVPELVENFEEAAAK